MDPQTISIFIIASILGAAIIGSYVPIVRDTIAKKYDYWVGLPKYAQYFSYAIWILAAIGFITYIFGFLKQPPQASQGLFSHGTWIRPFIISIALLFSIGWSLTSWTHFHLQTSKAWISISLILVAIASILLLAGEVEADTPSYQVLGLFFFAVNTVLIDGVMWNAKLWMK